MSTTYHYPDGRESVTTNDRKDMTVRMYHLYAAFAHSWDFAPNDVWVGEPRNQYRLPNHMKEQAFQWSRAFQNLKKVSK